MPFEHVNNKDQTILTPVGKHELETSIGQRSRMIDLHSTLQELLRKI